MATLEPGTDPHRGPDLLGGASRPRLRGSALRHPRIPLHARRRAAFLAQASATLSASLDYDSTLKSVADLAVPHLADWCAVCVLDAEGEVRLVAAAHPDPSKVPLAWDESRRYLLRLSAPHGPGRVIHTGEPELVSEISDSLLRAVARGAEHLALLRGLGFVSYMAVPLSARGRTLGAITFASAESGRRFGRADLALAEELAHGAALAVDKARHYEAEVGRRPATEAPSTTTATTQLTR